VGWPPGTAHDGAQNQLIPHKPALSGRSPVSASATTITAATVGTATTTITASAPVGAATATVPASATIGATTAAIEPLFRVDPRRIAVQGDRNGDAIGG
jgi:hypothetical protein